MKEGVNEGKKLGEEGEGCRRGRYEGTRDEGEK